MKPLKYFRETPGLCGPASLKVMLSHYGKDYSEAELAKLSRGTPEEGTDHQGLIDAVTALGYTPIVKADATIDDLRASVAQDTPVLVGWFSDDGDHYGVVFDVTDKEVSMMDQQLDDGVGVVAMPLKEFESLWYDFDGPERQRINHWMLTISQA